MSLIKTEKINKIIDKEFNYNFEVANDGIYLIEITARASSRWQNLKQLKSIFRRDVLVVEIDGLKFPALQKKSAFFDGEMVWNGNQIKGLAKTEIFVIYLQKGTHSILFLNKVKPTLENIVITQTENEEQIDCLPTTNNPPEPGDGRPWLSYVFVNLAVKELKITAKADKKSSDDEDVKLIIDGHIEKNDNKKTHRDWLWCGKILKGQTQEITKALNFDGKGTLVIELWVDLSRRSTSKKINDSPQLNSFSVFLDSKNSHITTNQDPIKNLDEFNPFYVIKDSAFVDNNSMTEKQIQMFLDSYNTQKQKRHIANMQFESRSAAYWIKKSADDNLINPKLLLTKLQVEQRLIKGEKAIDPSVEQLDWAMGVGALDTGERLKLFQGFSVQINSAAKYFRQYYNEAKANELTHKNVDGQPLIVLNASTYCLYKYTPHIEGAKLVYKVYRMFFDTEDLGGVVVKKESFFNKIKLPLAVIVLFLTLSGNIWAKTTDKTVYSFKNSIDMGGGFEVVSEVEIFSIREVQENDGPYCGYRTGKIFESNVKLSLFSTGRLVDSINLTNPELIANKDFVDFKQYYLPHDIDGDGTKKEFVVREYVSCNGDRINFVRLNENLGKFENIPIITEDGGEIFFVYSGIEKGNLQFRDGLLEVRFYNNAETSGRVVGFYKNYYVFDKKIGGFVWNKEIKE